VLHDVALPAATPNRTAPGSDRPRSNPSRIPATIESPAPALLSTSTCGEQNSASVPSTAARNAPLAPERDHHGARAERDGLPCSLTVIKIPERRPSGNEIAQLANAGLDKIGASRHRRRQRRSRRVAHERRPQ
jgi:hypothetical protein